MYYELDRAKWKTFNRTFEQYHTAFLPFLNMITSDYRLIVFIDRKVSKRIYNTNKYVHFIEIDNDFMFNNFASWSRLDREREIMNSQQHKELIKERLKCPETYIPEYTLINHCKIDALAYVINNRLVECDNYAWVDFGYMSKKCNIPANCVDMSKLDLTRITYNLLNPIDDKDGDIIRTLILANERISGEFFIGNSKKLLEYQHLYHDVLNFFQTNGLADDDQHIALICYLTKPELFNLVRCGGWHKALIYFQ